VLRGALIISVCGLAIAYVLANRDLDEALAGAWGDWPAVPEGMRLAADLVGEGTAKTASAQTQTSVDRTHRWEGI
jgi:hypothetical protein